MTQIFSLISHISFSCIEKVIDPTVGRQKVKRVEMCLLPDFVVWWSHAEKAAPPQPSRSYWEPSHRDRNIIFTTSRLIWSVYSGERLEDSLLRMFKSVISGLREFECYSQSCLSSYHLPSPAALGPCRYRQKQADSQTSRQLVVQSDRQVVVQSDRQTGGRSVSQTGTCTVRWWASRSSTPAAAASGLRLSCCSDPLWGPQTAARPPWTWWWRECEWLIGAVSFGKIGQSQASHFPLLPVFMLC